MFFVYLLLRINHITKSQSSWNLSEKSRKSIVLQMISAKNMSWNWTKKALSLSNPSPNTPKTRNRKVRMSDAEMITTLVLFNNNTFRNFKHFYLFHVCRELKEEFPHLLSYTRFVERMPRVAIPLLLFLKLALMGECAGITFIDSTRILCRNDLQYNRFP